TPLGSIEHVQVLGTLPLSGSFSYTIPATWANGVYRLDSAYFYDGIGNGAGYERGGGVHKMPSGASGPTSHSLDFNALDLSMSGSTVDTAIPVLSQLSVSSTGVRPGDRVSFAYEASDEQGSLGQIDLRYWTPLGSIEHVQVLGTLPLSGSFSYTIPATWANGVYRLDSAYLYDGIGNGAGYERGGGVHKMPSGASGPTSHSLDFNALDLTWAAAPGAPESVRATAGDGQVSVSWSAPASDGGSPVTGYTVTASPGGKSVTTSGATSAVLSGLSNGTSYTFTVVASNAAGAGAASTASAAVMPTAPDLAAPVLSEFDFTPKSVDVNAGAKSVTVTARVTDATGAKMPTLLLSSDSSTQTLGFGSMTRVSGTATDGVYQSTVSIPSTAAPGSWTVQIYPLGDTLGNSDNTFHAHPSKLTVSNTPPVTVPGAPSEVSAIAGDGQATVVWTAPSSDGGSPITGYTVTAFPGGKTVTTTWAASAVVDGLANGTAYTFSVTASNAAGTSPPSEASAPVTPKAVDLDAPVLSEFDFTPKIGDANAGPKTVTVSARLTDATGAKAPILALTSVSGTEAFWMGPMTRVSGSATDGLYQRTFSIPSTAAPGLWTVQLDPLEDINGNSDRRLHAHPSKLTITDTPPDTAAPVVSEFDFTPKTVNVNSGAQSVSVTVRVTDATGVRPPTMVLRSDWGGRTLGLGTMTLVSGTVTDGVYQRTVSIPPTEAPGTWTVQLDPVVDTLGYYVNTFHIHPSKLTVTNTPPVTVPGAPSGVSAVAGDGQASLSWSAPVSDGGSSVTGYTVTASPGGKSVTTSGATSAVVTGLVNGTSYTFTVVASNAAGMGAASAPSASVTPIGKLTAAPTPTVSGTAKVGYAVTASPGVWGPAPVSLAYRWYRVSSTGAVTAITGATGLRYVATSADRGYRLKVTVTGSKTGYTTVARTSALTAAVATGTLTAAPSPKVSGTAKVGYALTASPGVWGPAPVSLAYRWYRVSSTGAVTAITGATGLRYLATSADRGYRLKVTVTGSKAGYTSLARTSPLTTVVAR
ncbi:fibronectin type III domain-containing protein, partial [Terrabacter sp. AAH1]